METTEEVKIGTAYKLRNGKGELITGKIVKEESKGMFICTEINSLGIETEGVKRSILQILYFINHS